MMTFTLPRAALALAAVAMCACNHRDSGSTETGSPEPSTASAASSPPAAPTTPSWRRPRGMADASWTPVPFITPIIPGSVAIATGMVDAGPPAPLVKRAPDWDLATDDPARDYARRYAYFTKRYPDGLSCAVFRPSQPAGDRRSVTVTADVACANAGAVRDVFIVDLAGDHLSVDDKSKRNPLARWPDGSDPEGPAAPDIRQIQDISNWKSPLHDALLSQELAPIRVQAYGRGTYSVVTIAGWHGRVQLNATPDALQPLADAMCKANDQMPMGIVAGFDRTHLLRIRCPATTRWDYFQPEPQTP
jgi:hypothetical protein